MKAISINLPILILLTLCSSLKINADTPRQSAYAGAPQHVKDYFDQIKRAEKIEDPVERCIAFPNLPNNSVTLAHIRERCRLEFSQIVGLEQVKSLVEKNQLDALDNLYKAHLNEHFDPAKNNEIIHRDFNDAFDSRIDAGVITKLWIEKAPNSAFANAARGHHLLSLGIKARGKDLASNTPKEKLSLMKKHFESALPMLQNAIKLEPRLISVVVDLLQMNRYNASFGSAEEIFQHGVSIEPACRYLAIEKMSALTPRWGGSYKAMRDYARTLEPYISKRPLISNITIMDIADKANSLHFAERYDDAVKMLTPVVSQTTNTEATSFMGLSLFALNRPWDALLHLMQSYRFGDNRFANEQGQLLIYHAQDYQLAYSILNKALNDYPDDQSVRYRFAEAALFSEHYAEAENNYEKLTSSVDLKLKQNAMHGLIHVSMTTGKHDKAKIYLNRLSAAFPSSKESLILSAQAFDVIGEKKKAVAALKKFLTLADANDPDVPAMKDYIAKYQ